MRKSIVIILGVITAFNFYGCKGTCNKAGTPELNQLDYEIISDALKDHSYSNEKYFLIDSTFLIPPQPYMTDVLNLIDSNYKYLAERITGENKKVYYLDKRNIDTTIKVRSREELHMYPKEDAMEIFLIRVSKPSFSEHGDMAVLFLQINNWDTNNEFLYFMKKRKGDWIVFDKMQY